MRDIDSYGTLLAAEQPSSLKTLAQRSGLTVCSVRLAYDQTALPPAGIPADW